MRSGQHQKAVIQALLDRVRKENREQQRSANFVLYSPQYFRLYEEKMAIILNAIEFAHAELVRLDTGRLQLCLRCSKLIEDGNETNADSLLNQANMDAMSINDQVLMQEIATSGHQINFTRRLSNRSMSGDLMVWKVTSVREQMQNAQLERQTSVYSPPFYTSAAGYKLCLRLYLNGDGTARGTHISIFLVVLRGEYDALLQWPFCYRVSFCLVDQRTSMESEDPKQAKHVINSFRPDVSSSSFQRPCTSMNTASGLPKFISLTDFNQPAETNRYCVDDTIFIKVFINFMRLPVSMIPFVMTIDLALPTFIQARLIAEEKKRYNKQHSDTD